MFDRLRLRLERRLDRLTGAAVEQSTPVLDPAIVENLRAKGNAYIASGSLDKAESCFRTALTHAPNNTPLLICLGYVLKEQGRLAEARFALRRAAHSADQHPEIFEAFYLLGQISEQQADWDDALRQFTAALERKPDFVRACTDSLRMLIANQQKSDVPLFLEERIKLCPAEREYHLILARYWHDVGNYQGAVDSFVAAIALGAPLTDINMSMGGALLSLCREEESRPFLEGALATDPALAHYIDTITANYFGKLGDDAAAIALLERAITMSPEYRVAHSTLLMILSYSKLDAQRQNYIVAAERFAKTVGSAPQPPFSRHQKTAPPRALRIGFVAGEFKHHPILHFLLGMLENFDASRICTVAFSNNVYDDSGTTILKSVFDEWVEIRDVDDAVAAEMVRSQNVDVLLDLCGHTGEGRLALFAQRLAPVQATWLGYWASTGLRSMDYIIADSISIPDGSSEWFSETVYRLPATRLCMTPPRSVKPIPTASPPCLHKGYVTFGSFQRTSKLNEGVLALWGRVLREVPLARLRIQTDTAKIDFLRDQLLTRLHAGGLDVSRVDLIAQTSADLYLAAHSEVDIILDTFPFTGGTTTAQALWMGVPTVTLSGDTMLTMQGAAMLNCVGLTDWIAQDEDDYIRIACRFANDPQHLEQLRNGLRDRALQSPLFDVTRFAHDFTDGLWDMYRKSMHPVEVF